MKHFKPESFSKPNFARWVLAQHKRDDQIGELAKSAHSDPKFPVDGDVEAVTKRLSKLGADPDTLCAVEDAELEWLAI